jgi:hypothetical protein
MGYPIAVGIFLTGLFAVPFVTYLPVGWARRADRNEMHRARPPSPNRPRRSIPGGNSREQ